MKKNDLLIILIFLSFVFLFIFLDLFYKRSKVEKFKSIDSLQYINLVIDEVIKNPINDGREEFNLYFTDTTGAFYHTCSYYYKSLDEIPRDKMKPSVNLIKEESLLLVINSDDTLKIFYDEEMVKSLD